MRHVLLPTDFGDTSYKAALFALQVYGTHDVQYTLLNTYLKPAYRHALVALDADPELDSITGLRRIEQRMRRQAGRIQVAVRNSNEPLVEAIADLHRAKAVDVVVMGTQGEGRYGPVGRNTAAVVTGVHLPVIAVPGQWEAAPIKDIVLADDGQPVDPRALQPLLEIAARCGAHVHVVHVGGEDHPGHVAKALLAGLPHSMATVSGEDVGAALDAYAADHAAQLVAVVHRQRSFLQRIFQGSTSKRMAVHTTVPMLVLHQEA